MSATVTLNAPFATSGPVTLSLSSDGTFLGTTSIPLNSVTSVEAGVEFDPTTGTAMFTVGGGIRTADEAAAVFDAGVDKISINSAALARPELIGEIGAKFGAQAVIVAIDARRASEGPIENAEVYVAGGRKPTGRRAVEWAREAEERGAGEILLTSMDADGTRAGFDCELTAAVSEAVQIPVIASGGAGTAQHFTEVFRAGRADAALAASIFHFGIADVRALKQELQSDGIPVRLPC